MKVNKVSVLFVVALIMQGIILGVFFYRLYPVFGIELWEDYPKLKPILFAIIVVALIVDMIREIYDLYKNDGEGLFMDMISRILFGLAGIASVTVCKIYSFVVCWILTLASIPLKFCVGWWEAFDAYMQRDQGLVGIIILVILFIVTLICLAVFIIGIVIAFPIAVLKSIVPMGIAEALANSGAASSSSKAPATSSSESSVMGDIVDSVMTGIIVGSIVKYLSERKD